MNLKELHEFLGKLLQERPELDSGKLKQVTKNLSR